MIAVANQPFFGKAGPVTAVLLALLMLCGPARLPADEIPAAPAAVRHQVTGLFQPERVNDLREAFAELPGFKLVKVDYRAAEVVVEYDPRKVFSGVKPEQFVERFDQLRSQASGHTLGIKPVRAVPLEKLRYVEIPVAGLDCKACCLAAYEAVYRLKGVEMATASFREGRVTAFIDPDKVQRADLEQALRQRGVEVKARP